MIIQRLKDKGFGYVNRRQILGTIFEDEYEDLSGFNIENGNDSLRGISFK
jgi:hypothetical protein